MSTETPREVIFSAMMRRASFRDYALNIHQPHTAAGTSLVRFIRNDPRFPADLTSAAALKSWVRYGPRMPFAVRQEASPLWASYAAWRRARMKRGEVTDKNCEDKLRRNNTPCPSIAMAP